MKKYLLKEYGSWAVAATAFVAGLQGSAFSAGKIALAVICCFLIINSKEAFSKWVKFRDIKGGVLFSLQLVAGALIFLYITGKDITGFLPFATVPVCYLLFFKLKGEHFIVTEVLGFMVLSLTVLVSFYISTEKTGYIIYLIVALYFAAGVFKVRMQLRKDAMYRVVSFLYLLFVVVVYKLINVSLVLSVPLIDNLVFLLKPYRIKLKQTGWIELVKSVLFVILLFSFYNVS